MLLIDDILFSPVHSILWVFKEIHHAVEEEQANEADAITAKLSDLYMMLETGQMTEAEFDAAEKALLDRLDVIKEWKDSREEEDDSEDEMVLIRERGGKK
jgi:hypothetical protein